MRCRLSRVRGLAGMALLTCMLVACGGHASISIPPVTASSDVVLDSYLQALVAGDCVSARAMESGQLAGECDTTIRKYAFAHDGGFSLSPGSAEYTVTLTTQGRAGQFDGDNTWFYYLAQEANGAWQVTSCGSGP